MRTYQDAKLMAKALRAALAERGIALSHGDCLDLVSRQFECRDWNVLSARIGEGDTALRVPEGWVVTGARADLYEIGVDPADPGSPAIIRSRSGGDDPASFGTLMQSVAAARFRGKQLRLRAELMTEDVTGAATLWMRIDRAPGVTLRFDNMETRSVNGALKGSTGWTPREIVLDVPDDAESIHFGFYQRGNGRTLARNFAFGEAEAGGGETPRGAVYPDAPANLDFSTRSNPGG